MSLTEQIHIRGRFQRAIRIDHDFFDSRAIDGFHCPTSSANVLLSMANQISQSGQCAFTWTGPYGSGKSSLVIFLCALLSQNNHLRKRAFASLDRKVADEIRKQFGGIGWNVIPVVGRRENPAIVIGEVIESLKISSSNSKQPWTDSRVVSSLTKGANSTSGSGARTILFVDEMGKFLESAADNSTDLYLFQQIAETACRSDGRFIFVGILHQAFGEYASKLTQTTRDEWTKIQGRFVDLTLRATVEEQIHILSRAIKSDHEFKQPSKRSYLVASSIGKNITSVNKELAENLERCWPLHPVVACLLGPMSKSRFGQNQRSVFGFLSSAEPHGFQEFIRMSRDKNLYEPDRLWDYLRANLESSIYASPEGHRWALATESVDRCEAKGGSGIEIKLLKTIAILDFFRNRSGLVANFKVLDACMTGYSRVAVRNSLKKIQVLSFVVYRKFIDGYSIYAGSDFDIDTAVEAFRDESTEVDFTELKTLAGHQPILAKRHYHKTGALRWFDVAFAPLKDVVDYVTSYKLTNNAIGLFLIAVPTQKESFNLGEKLCRVAGRQAKKFDVVVGLSQHSWKVVHLYEELLALQRVNNERPELAGDSVARREIQTRLASLQANLETELSRTMDSAIWFLKHHKPKRLHQTDLSILASTLADRKFRESPRIHVELLNRTKPSNNAIAAQNALLRRMVLNCGEKRLGIQGYPAEYAFFVSLLEQTGLYAQSYSSWGFESPVSNSKNERFRIKPLWDATLSYLRKELNNPVKVSEIYEIWRKPPFGVKNGLMTILIVAFIFSQKNNIAFYREGVFQVNIREIDVEFLAKHPEGVSVRWIEHSQASKELLSNLAIIAKEFNQDFVIQDQSPINIARGLVAIFENLPQWTIRTNTLSSNAIRVRTLFKQASDPNRFLFDDLPNSIARNIDVERTTGLRGIIDSLHSGLKELVEAYPKLLFRLRDNLLKELRVPDSTERSFQILRERADNVTQISGDFRLEAFIGRLTQIGNTIADIEGLASLAANKLPNLWVDSDFDRSNLELANLAQKFIHIEAFARVKGRTSKRQAIAIILGVDEHSTSLIEEFDVADTDQDGIIELADRITHALNGGVVTDRNVVLAALAKVSADYIHG